jgi:hypothetical protein
MAIAAPSLGGRPLRDDVVNPRPSQSDRDMSAEHRIDRDAETMARESPLVARDALRNLSEPVDADETTRALTRDEMIRHQDVQVVVGADAMGDEATMAVAPGQVDLGPEAAGIAAALVETLKNRESGAAFPAGPPAFPPPHGGAQPGTMMMQQRPQLPHEMQQQPQLQPQAPWGGEITHLPGSFHGYAPPSQPMQQPQSYDPMMPQHGGPPVGGYPSSGPHPAAPTAHPLMHQGYPQQPMQPMQGMQQMQPLPGQAGQNPGQNMGQMNAPWMQPAHGPGGSRAPSRQLIVLIAVGAVCLAIFIIGIVLFVTTKFS